ncbi:Uncharacterised protein [Helicobacter mustelae]|nr:Uncharacterised protein [Helicobacter mustelae]STP12902.1 Uncharacterised protein [Helicobacter mustelae]
MDGISAIKKLDATSAIGAINRIAKFHKITGKSTG